jgi:NOL1/NOP2/fmu family ribosome biogenesis protein
MYYPGMSVRFWRAGIELGLTEAGINGFEMQIEGELAVTAGTVAAMDVENMAS